MAASTDKLHLAVRVELVRPAWAVFCAMHKKHGPKRWSGKAEDAVLEVVQKEHWETRHAYAQRCFALRKLTKAGVPRSLAKWWMPGGALDGVLIDAAAVAPLRRNGTFPIKKFRATVENMSTNLP
jgi:hypothetical protein